MRILTVLLATLLCAGAILAADNEKRVYQITIESDGKAVVTGMAPFRAEANTQFVYARKTNGAKVQIFDVSSNLVLKQNGELIRDSSMDRNGIVFRHVDVDRTRLVKNALPSMQAHIYERYDNPFCTVTLDADQREVSREYSKLESHQPPDSTMADNYQIFHPAFPAAASWEQPVSMMEAKGTFKYTKVGEPQNGRQKVQVEGTLINPDKRLGDIPLGKETFSVKGTQEFDLAKKEWVAGVLTMDTRARYSEEGGNQAAMDAVMKLTFEPKKD